jgi:hypothetical protein
MAYGIRHMAYGIGHTAYGYNSFYAYGIQKLNNGSVYGYNGYRI